MKRMERVEPEQPSQVGKPAIDPSSESALECRLDLTGEAGVAEDVGEPDVERTRGHAIARVILRRHGDFAGESDEPDGD